MQPADSSASGREYQPLVEADDGGDSLQAFYVRVRVRAVGHSIELPRIYHSVTEEGVLTTRPTAHPHPHESGCVKRLYAANG